MNHCVSSANGNYNTDANPDNIIFTIRETILYVLMSLYRQEKTY